MTKKKARSARWATPPRSYHRTLANRLGLQVARVLWFELRYRIRRLLVDHRASDGTLMEAMRRDGYVVVRDFLPQEDYARLRSAYHAAAAQAPTIDVAGPKLHAPVLSNPKTGESDALADVFRNSDTLNALIEDGTAHRQNLLPLIRLHHYWIEEADLGLRESARTDELHYDVPMKNYRAFYYVEDCDAGNAAFEYARGTHRFGLRRLVFEYLDSIAQAKAREGRPDAKVAAISQGLLDLIGAGEPDVLAAPGNSLIVFDTMGLHRRGRFSRAGSREAILLDYRYLDAPANYEGYAPPVRWLG